MWHSESETQNMLKKLFLLVPLALTGCAAWHGSVDSNAMLTSYTVDQKKPACVCVKPSSSYVRKATSVLRDYYLDTSAIDVALNSELSKFFDVVRGAQDVKTCDYIVTPAYSLFADTSTEYITADLQVEFANQVVPDQSFTVLASLGLKEIHTNKSETSERLQRLVELGFQKVLYTFDQELSSNLEQHYVDFKKQREIRSKFATQLDSPSKIVQNPDLGISIMTDSTFEILSKDIIFRSMDKKKMADGPTKLREWDMNNYKLQKEEGQLWFLAFSVSSIRPVRGEPDKAQLTCVNQYVPKYPYYLTISVPTQADKDYLSNLEVGATVPIVYTANKRNSGMLAATWMIAEGLALKPYAIRYLSGQDEPKDKEELRKWELAKRTLAASIVAEKKTGVHRCIVDHKFDKDTQVDYLMNCFKSLGAVIPVPSEKEIDKQVKILDGKMAKLKK